MSTRTQIDTLIQGYQKADPRLYDILAALAAEIDFVYSTLLSQIQTTTAEETEAIPEVPTSFTYSLPGTYLGLAWNNVGISGSLPGSVVYEIRRGSNWNTADFVLRTNSLSAQLNPITYGTYTYLLKTINSSGVYSNDTAQVVVLISTIGVFSLTSNVIDNNVLLYWETPTLKPFDIAYYEIYRDGSAIGTKVGTFTIVFETVGGSYTYGVKAYDIAGNASGLVELDVDVSEPPDFELIDIENSTFTGTLTNCVVEEGRLLAPVVDETFEDHFIDNSWDSPQDQIDAGYPVYIQPAESTAEYIEKFDFGSIYTNTIATVNWSKELVTADDVVVTCEIEYSDDDVTYSGYVSGTSQFIDSARYVRIKLTFTPDTDKALVYLSNLTCKLDVKYATDSGDIAADSTDVGGTFVAFNKTFKDVNSITVSVLDTSPYYVIYDFTDVPNPSGFYVYVFDTGGSRASKTVSWKARGII